MTGITTRKNAEDWEAVFSARFDRSDEGGDPNYSGNNEEKSKAASLLADRMPNGDPSSVMLWGDDECLS